VGLGHIRSGDCARSGISNGRKYGKSGADLGSGCFNGITDPFIIGNGVQTKSIYRKLRNTVMLYKA
jgi:hypothetical protein